MAFDDFNGLTFGDIALHVAVRCNLAIYENPDDTADDRPRLPTNPHDLQRVKDAAQEGYDLFLRSGTDWTFCHGAFTLATVAAGDGPRNLGGDAGRYMLPGYIQGQPKTDWRFMDESSPYRFCQQTTYDDVDHLRAQNPSNAGPPRYAACRPIPTKNEPTLQQHGWEVVFYPSPDAAYTLKADFRVRKHTFGSMLDRHIAGTDHDHTIKAAALWCFKRDDAEAGGSEAATYEVQWLQSLSQSKALDASAKPISRGRLTDPSIGRESPRSSLGELQYEGSPLG